MNLKNDTYIEDYRGFAVRLKRDGTFEAVQDDAAYTELTLAALHTRMDQYWEPKRPKRQSMSLPVLYDLGGKIERDVLKGIHAKNHTLRLEERGELARYDINGGLMLVTPATEAAASEIEKLASEIAQLAAKISEYRKQVRELFGRYGLISVGYSHYVTTDNVGEVEQDLKKALEKAAAKAVAAEEVRS